MSTQLRTRQPLAAAPTPLVRENASPWADACLQILFTAGIFFGAFLLFSVQPLVGKLLLPKLGGAPAVWNTCMLFFQAVLLLGYLAAHVVTNFASLRRQVAAYVFILAVGWWTLPFAIRHESIASLLAGASPVGWMLQVLFIQVAPAFFALSLTSPLLQNWFSRTGHRRAQDPYFLYAASNVGSLLALAAYPLWIESLWGVPAQAAWWRHGFAAFGLLATLCGIVSVRRHLQTPQAETGALISTGLAPGRLTTPIELTGRWWQRTRWIALAALPSSLLLGVTTYISTDVSSIPLVWAAPLGLYLLTFVLAFSRKTIIPTYWAGRIAALLALTVIVTVVTGANDPPAVIIPLHLLLFFLTALVCHQRLAAERPQASRLTEFYLCLSVGGVVGGLINALLAPALLTTLAEYPLAMIIATWARDTRPEHAPSRRRPHAGAFALGIFLLTVSLQAIARIDLAAATLQRLAEALNCSAAQLQTLLVFGPPACLVLHQLELRARFGLGLAAIFLTSLIAQTGDVRLLEQNRNFYGTLATARDQMAGGEVRKMFHGNTVHGWQWTDPLRRREPLTYYGPSSGAGRWLAKRLETSPFPLRVGAIGLGAGSLAGWLREDDSITFYEINPLVLRHAESYFTYLSDARERGVEVDTRLGDARLVLEDEAQQHPSDRFDLLVVDAFSSDSIPVHLMTQECLQLYLQRLRPDGVLAFHISNRYLRLAPVLRKLAEASHLAGVLCVHRSETGAGIDGITGETMSTWVLLTPDAQTAATLTTLSQAQPLPSCEHVRLWTDDYSHVLSAFEIRF